MIRATLKFKAGIAFAVSALLVLSACRTSKDSEKNATKYVAGYHVLSDSVPAGPTDDSVSETARLGFIPVLRPGETEMSKREFNKQFRHYKKELRKDRADKRTQGKRDFVVAKKQVRQQGKTDRVQVKQTGKTNRVEAKQTGRTKRVEVRRKNGIFSGKFSLNILLLIFLAMFVVLIIYLLRRKFKANGTDEAS